MDDAISKIREAYGTLDFIYGDSAEEAAKQFETLESFDLNQIFKLSKQLGDLCFEEIKRRNRAAD